MRTFSPKEKRAVISLYKKGIPIYKIKKAFKTRCSTISKILKDTNIAIRLGRTVETLPYKLNHNYFTKINTQNKAYLLGLLYADGCVASESNAISLVSNDVELLEFFKSQIKCNKSFYKNPQHKNALLFSFASPQMKADLIKLGCIPRKSLKVEFPPKNLLEDSLIPHFLRGNFDGDGSILKSNGQTQCYFLCGTIEFAESIKEFLNKNNIRTNKIQRNVKIFRLRITAKGEILKLKRLLYKNSIFKLQRKFERFCSI